jgi:uncharacterized membrane protein
MTVWDAVKAWLMPGGADELAAVRFEFNVPLGLTMSIVLLVVGGLVTLHLYRPRLAGMSRISRTLLATLRTAVFLLVLFMLLDPCIVGSPIKPGEQFVILLFDDSRSMQIVGEHGLSRGEQLLKAYRSADSSFEKELTKKSHVVRYRLGNGIERISDVKTLAFTEPETDLLGALENAVRDLDGTTVSGVVLFSDGVQQPARPEADMDRLAALSVPIFTVGADTTARWRDLELGNLSVKRTTFDKSPVVAAARVYAEGLAGEEAVVEVLDRSRVVKSETVAIAGDSEDLDVRMEFVPRRKGRIEYEARVRLAETGPAGRLTAVKDISVPAKDRVIHNNSRRFIVDNRDKIYRILYLCGRPTWENKFFRRAMEEDTQLKLTSLVRISGAERKFEFRARRYGLVNPLFEGFTADTFDQPRYDEAVFIRMGVKKSELAKGYPDQTDELFPFHLVIWGDIEHNFFSLTQLELTRDFVQKRGGALLLTGGRRSFAEGGYAGTLIDDMLPVVLRAAGDESRRATSEQQFTVEPTVDGLFTGAWSLDANADKNRKLWASMQESYGLNAFPLTRAGASVMARVKTANAEFDDQPLFAVQRYGEGKSAVLATGETWQWQMKEDEDDQRHERLWRQIVRSLVTSVPEHVVLRDKKDSYTVGSTVAITTLVRDSRFDEREGLHASMNLIAPSGHAAPLPVDESIHETGAYASEFDPEEAGVHLLRFEALNDKHEVVGTLEEALLVEPDRREFQTAQYNPMFLQDIATRSGGAHFSLDHLSDVVDRIPWRGSTESDEIRIRLWHLPPLFFALVAMLAVEWLLRRRKGHP